MPTNQPKKRTKQRRTQAHTRTHSHTRGISEGNVGSEAQFFARENEVEFRLGLDFRVGLQGHLSKTPSGGLVLRWPHRPDLPLHEILKSGDCELLKLGDLYGFLKGPKTLVRTTFA